MSKLTSQATRETGLSRDDDFMDISRPIKGMSREDTAARISAKEGRAFGTSRAEAFFYSALPLIRTLVIGVHFGYNRLDSKRFYDCVWYHYMQEYLRMVQRRFWQRLVEQNWHDRSVVWLAGVRRVGKTFLCQSLSDIEYFDCELPRTRRMMEDAQAFLEGLGRRRIVLDEVHRLPNPSELLKIAADHYPNIRVLATGSSTLGASAKFKDTLAGRKRNVWLTPMCLEDLKDAKRTDLRHRFLRGGLPPFFLAERFPERDFQEWMDAYWAKDIQELFRLERRSSFQKFTELLMTQSGGLFEATRFTAPCEVSRTTISNYLNVLEATFVAHIIRPFSTHRPTEIVSAPKVYGFDTGFVAYYRGWQDLRREDLGVLWEHFVLNEIMAHQQNREISYWRDKRGHEIDFILTGRRNKPIAVECKWSVADFDATNVQIFRRQYSDGENFVVAHDVDRPYSRRFGEITVRVESLDAFVKKIGLARADA